MEQKKELIIKVLTKLKPYRNLAEGILALIESSYCDEKTIDGLLKLINTSIKQTKNKKDKSHMQKGLELIQKIQSQEQMEKESENIDQLLENL